MQPANTLLEEARRSICQAVGRLQVAGGLRLNQAVSVLRARAVLGELEMPLADALRLAAADWPSGNGAVIPPVADLVCWVQSGNWPVCACDTEAAFNRYSHSVAEARRWVVGRLRELQRAGLSLDVAITLLLSEAEEESERGLEVRSRLEAARDIRGRRVGGATTSMPSRKSLWRWLAQEQLAPKSSAPQEGLRRPWMVAADRYLQAEPAMTASQLRRQLVDCWLADWGEQPVVLSSVTRYMKRVRL
jgi:hypothetical protein